MRYGMRFRCMRRGHTVAVSTGTLRHCTMQIATWHQLTKVQEESEQASDGGIVCTQWFTQKANIEIN